VAEREKGGRRMTSPYKSKGGFKRIWNALFYSLDGFAAAFKYEDAFRLEVLLALILIPLAFSMHIGAIGKALMIASVLLVLIVELLNSAIEAITDRVSLENHVLAKRAKDFGSAAVMLSVINVVVVWLLVLMGGRIPMLD
jgi:diacylglycerol kinase (ATP)